MAVSAFDRLMQPLLRHLNVNAPTLTEKQGINIDFRHIGIQFTPLNEEELLIVASLGCPPPEHHPRLAWLLLAQNGFDQPAPVINLTAQGENNAILLWSRERFLNLDGHGLITLFERLVERSNETIRLIASSQTAT